MFMKQNNYNFQNKNSWREEYYCFTVLQIHVALGRHLNFHVASAMVNFMCLSDWGKECLVKYYFWMHW